MQILGGVTHHITRHSWHRNHLDHEKISHCIYCFMWLLRPFLARTEPYQRQYLLLSMDDWKMGYCGHLGSIGREFYEGIWIPRMLLGIGESSYSL